MDEQNMGKKAVSKLTIFLLTIIFLLSVSVSFLVIMFYMDTKDTKDTNDSKAVHNEPVEDEEQPVVKMFTEEELDKKVDDAVKSAAENVISEYNAAIKDMVHGNTSTVEILRHMFPEHMVVLTKIDGVAQYLYEPINRSLKMNPYKIENFIADRNGFLEYKEDNKVKSIKGIDVSRYQDQIDWAKVKESGVEYAILRLGYRGYGNGTLVKDETFDYNIENAIKNGIHVGVYFFTQAITKKEAKEEAEFILEHIKDYNVTYPIAFDAEDVEDPSARAANLSSKEITDICIEFCDTIKEAGYTPMIYANLKWFATEYEYERLEAYDKWYAFYDTKLYFPYDFQIWQYSDKGKVPGIEGNVDLNIGFKDYSK